MEAESTPDSAVASVQTLCKTIRAFFELLHGTLYLICFAFGGFLRTPRTCCFQLRSSAHDLPDSRSRFSLSLTVQIYSEIYDGFGVSLPLRPSSPPSFAPSPPRWKLFPLFPHTDSWCVLLTNNTSAQTCSMYRSLSLKITILAALAAMNLLYVQGSSACALPLMQTVYFPPPNEFNKAAAAHWGVLKPLFFYFFLVMIKSTGLSKCQAVPREGL